jgi:hypothetical protein
MKRLLLLIVATACAPAIAADAPVIVSELRPIALHGGVNTVPGFMPDGTAATIIQAWRGNGNAHSYADWLVLAPASEGQKPGVVTLDDPARKGLQDLVRDDPFDGERALGTIRFARGLVNGHSASLLLDAHLDQSPSGVLADHATATVRVFQLLATDDAPGESPYEFRLISTTHMNKRYCNAELALSEALKLPLGPDYAGFNRIDGCSGK